MGNALQIPVAPAGWHGADDRAGTVRPVSIADPVDEGIDVGVGVDVDIDLRAMIEDLIARAAPRAHQKRIELAYRIAPDLPSVLCGNRQWLRRALAHLLDNAIRFTERGEVVLAVRVAEPDSDEVESLRPSVVPDWNVVFEVRDTGIGMRPDVQERLFSRGKHSKESAMFASGHDGRIPGRIDDGAGRGLVVVRQIAESMGGGMMAMSRVGEGSVFRVVVPMPEGDPKAGLHAVSDAGSLAGKRILIVDDNPTDRQILEELLHAMGVDCACAENGRQALQMLRVSVLSRRVFAAALIDMTMPVMGGVELVRQIRSDRTMRGLRLVMLFSGASGDDPRQARQIGVDADLFKPVRRSDLVASLDTGNAAAGDFRRPPGHDFQPEFDLR